MARIFEVGNEGMIPFQSIISVYFISFFIYFQVDGEIISPTHAHLMRINTKETAARSAIGIIM